jgi:acetyl-CoA C-acetyltransferase
MAKDSDAVILSAARTPIGKFQGALSGIPATRLGAAAVQAAIARAGIDPAEIDETLLGNVVQAGAGQAPARQASIWGGIPASVGATTVNKVCGSGLKAAIFGSQAIRAGDADLIVAGGFESMSRAPYLLAGRSGELKFGHQPLTDALLLDGLWDPFEDWGMGMSAEFIATNMGCCARPWIAARCVPSKAITAQRVAVRGRNRACAGAAARAKPRR